MPYPSGHVVTADEFNYEGAYVKRGRRTTDKTGITAEVGVLRIDGMTLKANKGFLFLSSSLMIDGTTGETWLARFRINTTGAAATTTSTEIGSIQGTAQGSFVNAAGGAIVTDYYPGAADQTVSVILTLNRVGGSNPMNIRASAVKPLSIMVIALGLDPGDSGVSL